MPSDMHQEQYQYFTGNNTATTLLRKPTTRQQLYDFFKKHWEKWMVHQVHIRGHIQQQKQQHGNNFTGLQYNLNITIKTRRIDILLGWPLFHCHYIRPQGKKQSQSQGQSQGQLQGQRRKATAVAGAACLPTRSRKASALKPVPIRRRSLPTCSQ